MLLKPNVVGIFLGLLTISFPALGCFSSELASNDKIENSKQARAPFRLLYSNDTTNMVSNVSPWRKKGQPFSAKMIASSVDETAGLKEDTGSVDVLMLQPSWSWVPWWKSEVYPADKHYRWFMEKTGLPIDPISQYMLDGGDVVQVFIDQCKKRKIAAFVSFRLNDYHGNEYQDILIDLINGKAKIKDFENHKLFNRFFTASQSRFQLNHPEYRISPDPKDYLETSGNARFEYILSQRRISLRRARIFNWAIPEVRNHKLLFIKELCENYDIDGFELDFMRHSAFFKEDTPIENRLEIMTKFISDVRHLLDATAKPGKKRWLCIRVPFRLETHESLGIDLKQFVASGVEMVNLSGHFVCEQQSDLAMICRLIPDTAVYLELTFNNLRYGNVFRKMAREHFYTAAHLAYARGAEGVSFFNFVYYRSFSSAPTEPPFEIFKHVGDPQWLSVQPQHYFLTPGSNTPRSSKPAFPRSELTLHKPVTFKIDMAPPKGGWKTDGLIRVQSKMSLANRELSVHFNGVKLESCETIFEPYPTPDSNGLGTSKTLSALTVPVNLLRNGNNNIQIVLLKGKPIKLIFIDLAVK